jgi:UDP-2,4-diacetamido-2,4,6-trideoxy-beta-L-altropyranose hydrolase
LRSPVSAGGAAVFRLDASAAIGGGHAVRCSALADALSAEGWACTFVVAEPGAGTVRRLAAAPHRVVAIPHAAALDPGALRAAAPRCDLLVVDHYGWSEVQEAACRGWARRILALDDLSDRAHDCDLLLDMSIQEEASSADMEGLFGPGYALLRSAFAQARLGMVGLRAAAARRVFVSFGLMDERNMTEQALQALLEARFPGEVDVVLGAHAPHLARIQSLAGRSSLTARVHVEPRNVAALMVEADFAFGAAGGSAWERCCLGLPSIVVSAAVNQDRNARALAARGACRLVERFTLQALGLLGEAQVVERMARSAAAITDGRGAQRIALALRPEPGRAGGSVRLRRLTAADAELTHRWQQHPATRRHARNPAPPSREEHTAWLARKLADRGCVLDMVLYDGAPAGVVRLDSIGHRGERRACEVSIYIDPALHGRGVGAAALAALRRLAPEVLLLAHVLPENAASHALFEKAGYVLENGVYVNAPSAMGT